MNTHHRKENVYARAQAEADATRARLAQHGREPVERILRGSVRTYVWANRRNRYVPVLVEQLRKYTTATTWGTSRLMEASDLVYAADSLALAARLAPRCAVETSRPPHLTRSAVLAAVGRGDNPPRRVFVHGNCASLVWTNPAGDDDFVCKVEVLSADEFGRADRILGLSHLGDAGRCYADADRYVAALQRKMGGCP